MKTEVLVQMDGASTDQNDRILVMGATNLPWSVEAGRFVSYGVGIPVGVAC